MMDFLYGLVDFLVAIYNLIYNTVTAVVWAVTSIPKFSAIIVELFAYCPTFLLVFLEVSLALMIVFAIIKLL